MRLIIIGGVAGGATAAARARRLDEDAEITVIEKGPYVSFANCGLPYHIGGVIKNREQLLVQTPESLRARYNLNILVNSEAVKINRPEKSVTIKNADGAETKLFYDKLIISTGAEAFMPPIPGIDLENVFKLQTLSDMDSIIAAIKNLRIKKAAIIGGGFIGIEAAENLAQLGLDIHLIEADNQIMPPIDPEMAEIIQDKMLNNGIDLMLKTKAAAIEKDNEGLAVRFVGGSSLVCGLAVLAIGVRPNVSLARDAGLEIGAIGGIKTDERMRTSDSSIFAVGDAIEIYNPVTGLPAFIPLAGPANKQGRIAADQVFGRDSVYEGTIGTSICKVFNTAVAATGASEKLLKRLGKKFQKSYTHSLSHAGYYPGASPISIKIIFDPDSGQILGAQAIGADGADKRIDVITTAIKCGRTVFDLENLELGYAPPYGSAKDPVNIAGSVAANIIRGDHRIIHADDIIERDKASTFILDVRTAFEFQNGHIDGSVNIPLNELRDHLDEIPVAKQILVYCQVGLRGYIAQRILSQRGFDAANLSGGYTTFITRMESLQ